ncbi:MAG: SwmB domain-containing protein, partial [Burkholderiaceae bacterium]|nr:SwmB domain-containing protein [Burkholderiaceae bacterium]
MAQPTSLSTVQKLYIAYYGRPADVAGQTFWGDKLDAAQGSLVGIIDAFATSAEAQALYGASSTARERVTVLYQNILGRNPDTAGLNYYVDQINRGKLSLGNAALSILDGVQGADKPLADNRLSVAQSFTSQASPAAKSYEGDAAAAIARTLLQGVTGDAATVTTSNGLLDAYLNTIGVASKVPGKFAALIQKGLLSKPGIVSKTLTEANLDETLAALTPTTATTSGKAIDGYIAGATVFADANGNGQQDPGEVSATTDAKGNFTLPAGAVGNLVSKGGTDISTGLPFKGVLTAPAGSKVVNPLTTLVNNLVQSGQDVTVAQQKVAQALGLPANVDLTTLDPLNVATSSTSSAADKQTALALQKAAAVVANILVQTASAVAGAAPNANPAQVATQAAQTLANLIANTPTGQTLDLSSTATANNVLNAASQGLSSAEQAKLGQVQAQVAQVMAQTNQAVAKVSTTGTDPIAALADMAKAQVVAQGTAATALQQAVQTGNPAPATNTFTGSNLDTQVSQAKAGTIGESTPAPAPPPAPAPAPAPEPAPEPAPAPAPDTTAPTFVKAETSTNGTKVILTYNEALSATTAAKETFAVKIGDTANAVTAVAVSGSTVELTLTSALANGNSVTVAYAAPTPANAQATNNAVQDTAGNDAATLTTQTVTNKVPDTTSPTFSKAETSTDGTKVILTYNEALSATTAAKEAFTVKIGDTANAVTAVAVSGSTVELTLTSAVANGNSVTVAYAAPTPANAQASNNAVQDTAGNDAAALAVQTVTNNVAATIPTGTVKAAPIARATVASETAVNTSFNDPLFGSQWNLVNTGQRYVDINGGDDAATQIATARAKNGGLLLDINVMGAWAAGYTGKGIIQSVSDDGFDLAHEDIQGNLLADLAYNGATGAKAGADAAAALAAFSNRDNFAQPMEDGKAKVVNGKTLEKGDESHQHGTVVGTIAANQANNGKGIVGIAFDSKLIPAVILETTPAANTATHLTYLRTNNVAVSLNSYGADPAFSENYGDYNGNLLTAAGVQAPGANNPQQSNLDLGQQIRQAAEQGRGGLGMVLEFSAGNERGTKADSALTNGTGSRYVIAVGSVNEVGDVASYGSRGTNILVSAFGGAGSGDQKVNAGFGIVAGHNRKHLNTGYNDVDD